MRAFMSDRAAGAGWWSDSERGAAAEREARRVLAEAEVGDEYTRLTPCGERGCMSAECAIGSALAEALAAFVAQEGV